MSKIKQEKLFDLKKQQKVMKIQNILKKDVSLDRQVIILKKEIQKLKRSKDE